MKISDERKQVEPKLICPICGNELEIVTVEMYYRLKCKKCPLDFGRFWFVNKQKLIDAFTKKVRDANS